MIGMIAAVTQNGVIGVENKLPFDYPEDMKHFRTTTANSTVIMGRKTLEGIGRPLPKRQNFQISRTGSPLVGVETFSSMKEALEVAARTSDQFPNVWLIGGASIYEEGMQYADKIVLTLTPDIELRKPAVKFPWINPNVFTLSEVKPLVPENADCKLLLATYLRK